MLAFWWRPLTFGLALVLLGMLLWGWVGPVPALLTVLAALTLYVVRMLRQLFRLADWLRTPERPAPRALGVWGDAYYLLEKQLRQRQERQQKAVADLEQLLDATRSLPEGVVILDGEDRIAWLNDSAEQHLGLSRGRDYGQFIHYLLRNRRFVEWLSLEDYDLPLVLPSREGMGKTLSLTLVRMEGGQHMLISHDVTERERVDAMRRDFVANVSHELRTPITVIAGFLEGFDDMDDPDPAEFRKHVRVMREQTDRIRRLLDDLLTLARLESDPEMKNEPVDIQSMVRRMLREAEGLSQGRHEIALELKSDARLLGNEAELHSAFGNLVSNAVRYTPAGGRITLRWEPCPNQGVAFSVADTGEGIEPQHIPRLTERFYRVDRGRSRASGGTGLGLAIVKHILQRHEGRLRVESTLGKGSTFTAAFPPERVIPPESAVRTAPTPAAP